jgi:hypothetical protein
MNKGLNVFDPDILFIEFGVCALKLSAFVVRIPLLNCCLCSVYMSMYIQQIGLYDLHFHFYRKTLGNTGVKVIFFGTASLWLRSVNKIQFDVIPCGAGFQLRSRNTLITCLFFLRK